MTHDNPRYVTLDEAMEKVKALRDPMYEAHGFERAGWAAAINYVLSELDKMAWMEAIRDAR